MQEPSLHITDRGQGMVSFLWFQFRFYILRDTNSSRSLRARRQFQTQTFSNRKMESQKGFRSVTQARKEISFLTHAIES
jgi:hypothetical protein